MNKDQFQGAWKQLSGKVKEKWGKITDDEILRINGKRETLVGLLQQKYGYAKERAEDELTRFEDQLVGSGIGRSDKENPSFRTNNPNQPSQKRPQDRR
ncbi:MAG: CsbD family protein [Parachlamydiaceae bacterium]